MGDSEKIRGKRIFSILEQVKKNHTILNIHEAGTDFDGISIILGISDDPTPRFIYYCQRSLLKKRGGIE